MLLLVGKRSKNVPLRRRASFFFILYIYLAAYVIVKKNEIGTSG